MLGLLWDSSTDCLGFNTALHRVPTEVRDRKRPPTKREALATVMSIYDPLGLLSCYTITAKITLQKLWRIRTGWDESLPEDIAREFDRWLASIDTVRNLQIPRVYHGGRVICRRELHVFCDASEDAYATVGYWLLKYEDGHREAKLVAARARVAPLKTQTVPRLELQAALIGARLAKTIKEEHRAQVDQTTFWTDSQTVLHWIRNGSRRYTPYVAHRIGEITEETEATDWRWVPTHLNIADAATRAGYAICKDDEWFTGPAFLSRPKREWPRNDATEEEPVEVLHVTHALTDNGDAILPEIDRFSNFDRLIASTANVLLFVQKCRDRTAVLTSDLMGKATDLWI
jgi:ribonuclease HI